MLLEPVDEVSILVPDDYVGAVMSDLSGRRGRVIGSEPVGVGRTLIRAEVPELEITRYSIALRSVSHGTGSFTRGYLRHEPLPSGAAGFEFVDKIVGGVVPRQFIPSVEKGVRAQLEAGVLAGYPMTGVRVTLFDGKAHPVDSSDMAFQKAGRAALRDAAEKASPMLLEPVDEVSILVPDDYVGAVMSDLSGRRGRVIGTAPVGIGRTQIRAEVPELEIMRYSIDLRSVSHGTGSFTRGYLRHEPLPSHLSAKVAADSRPD